MIYIVDTHSWIDYFEGDPKAIPLRKIISSEENKLVTMECCLAELAGHAIRKDKNFEEMFEIIKANSVILPVLTKQWLESARIKAELRGSRPHFGLIDAILLSKQKELKCKIMAGDPHFKGLKNTIYIGE